jgi:hypothetical protein
MTNVIVHPDVYDRDRLAIRAEPFLWVKGKLAKDDGTLNVIAEEVRGLAVRRNGGTGEGRSGGTAERRNEMDSEAEPTAVPPYRHSAPSAAFRLLKSLRAVAPDSKDWG